MNLNESDLRTLLDTSHDTVAALFSAKWCGPCRAFGPIFENTAKSFSADKNGEKYNFAKLDVDECTQLCEDLGIGVVPTLIVFKDSKVLARKEGGFQSEKNFINWLNTLCKDK
jgi:thioredoxin-like negative regulator of GroEL